MQDEVNEKVVSLAIKTSKLTAEVLQVRSPSGIVRYTPRGHWL